MKLFRNFFYNTVESYYIYYIYDFLLLAILFLITFGFIIIGTCTPNYKYPGKHIDATGSMIDNLPGGISGYDISGSAFIITGITIICTIVYLLLISI